MISVDMTEKVSNYWSPQDDSGGKNSESVKSLTRRIVMYLQYAVGAW